MVKLKYHFLILFILGFVSVNAQIKIKGEFLNSETYDEVYLYEFFGRNSFVIDTIQLSEGKFEKSFENLERGFYRFGFEGGENFNMILGKESFSFEVDIKVPLNSLSFENSKENKLYREYLDFSLDYSAKVRANYEEQQAINEKPDSLQDQSRLNFLENERRMLDEERYTFLTQLQDSGKGMFMGKVATSSIYPDEASSFFTQNDFIDTEMTRGDMLSSKFMVYFQSFVPANLEDWKSSAQELIEKTPKNSMMREFYSYTFVEMVMIVARPYVWDVAPPFLEEYQDSKYFQLLLKRFPEKPLTVGDQAPEIALTDPTGNTINLSSLKGNVVLVDFWASWCGPCRKENPNVVKAYHEFKNKGFTVYGVSLDRDKNRWLQAIERDQLSWHHVSDLKGWKSEGASTYGVRAIPAAFLLNEDGVIIAKNLRGEELQKKLKEIFDQK